MTRFGEPALFVQNLIALQKRFLCISPLLLIAPRIRHTPFAEFSINIYKINQIIINHFWLLLMIRFGPLF
jgi:hypothetical protein